MGAVVLQVVGARHEHEVRRGLVGLGSLDFDPVNRETRAVLGQHLQHSERARLEPPGGEQSEEGALRPHRERGLARLAL